MRHAAARSAVPRRFVVHNRHELIQAAAVRVVAAKGYHATSVRDICAEAHITAKCFYEHFSGKEETVITAVEAGVDQVMGFCHEVYRAAPSWPDALWDGLHAYAEWAAAEPAFARTGIVEMLTIGPQALELLGSLMDAFSLFLEPGYEMLDQSSSGSLDRPLTQQIFQRLYLHVSQHSPETVDSIVPDLVRTTLTPFLGPQETERFIAERERQAPVLAPVR
jgi:AcrR family transcriptional regulator